MSDLGDSVRVLSKNPALPVSSVIPSSATKVLESQSLLGDCLRPAMHLVLGKTARVGEDSKTELASLGRLVLGSVIPRFSSEGVMRDFFGFLSGKE